MNTQESKVKTIEANLSAINSHIDKFQAMLEKLPSDIEGDVSNVVTDLQKKRSRLEVQLNSLKGATGSAYEDMQVGVQMAWDDLNTAYQSAKERFGKQIS